MAGFRFTSIRRKIGVIMGWLHDLFSRKPIYRETQVYDRYTNRMVDIGPARKIMRFSKEPHMHRFDYDVYELESGEIVVYWEEWFINCEGAGFDKYENWQEFRKQYDRAARVVKLEDVIK